MSMIEKYLNDDRTLERMTTAILEFRQRETGNLMVPDGKSAELAVYILNDLLDELTEVPEGPFEGALNPNA
jgi:hypothetical protein